MSLDTNFMLVQYQFYAVSDSVIILVCNNCLHRHVEITSFRIWCNVCSKDSLLDSKWLDKIKRLAYQIICSKSRLKGSNSYTLSKGTDSIFHYCQHATIIGVGTGGEGGGSIFFFAKLYITIIKDLPPFFSLVKIFYQSSPPSPHFRFVSDATDHSVSKKNWNQESFIIS